jgi:histidine triad (HIT) family protein
MDGCVFCAIGSGGVDGDLVAYASPRVFVLPALRQRARNRGHALVLPVEHVRNLHDARPEVRDEILAVVATLTRAFPSRYGAVGSYVFQHNVEPDGHPFHLHVHAVPRFAGDDFSEPDPAVAEVPRAERLAQTAVLRDLIGLDVQLTAPSQR